MLVSCTNNNQSSSQSVPAWWWTGNSDVDVEPEESQTMYDAYTQAGGVGRISRINGRNHGSIQIDLTNSDEWYDFLITKTKEGSCNHTYGDPVVTREGTCKWFAMYEQECSECHAKKVTYGGFGDHNFVEGTCTHCGAKE